MLREIYDTLKTLSYIKKKKTSFSSCLYSKNIKG
jgi:hypothetical protein